MSIGLDGNEANTTHRVGSNTYAYQILKGLHAQDSQTKYQIYLKNEPVADLPTSNKNWQYHTFGPGKLWTQWRLPLELYRQISKPDIIFSPGHYAPRFSPVPTVISIMDLAFLYYPEGFQPKVLNQLTNWTRYSVQNAAHIFAISNHTKNDLIKEYQLSPDKITVTPLGSNLKPSKDINAHQLQTLKKKYQITKPYFIFVGTQQPRKTLDRLRYPVSYCR